MLPDEKPATALIECSPDVAHLATLELSEAVVGRLIYTGDGLETPVELEQAVREAVAAVAKE